MMTDNKLIVCNDLAITAAAVLTNTITLSKSDIGTGRPLYMRVRVTTAFSGGNGTALRVELGVQSGGVLIFCANTGPVAVGLLIANMELAIPIAPWPQGVGGVLQVPLDSDTASLLGNAVPMTGAAGSLTEVGATFGAGKISVDITDSPGITPRLFPGGTNTYQGG